MIAGEAIDPRRHEADGVRALTNGNRGKGAGKGHRKSANIFIVPLELIENRSAGLLTRRRRMRAPCVDPRTYKYA